MSRGWKIAKQSFALIGKDPELLMFPVITFFMMALVWSSMTGVVVAGGYSMGPEYWSELGERVSSNAGEDVLDSLTAAEQGVALGYFLLLTLMTTLLGVAQKAAILNTMRVRLDGGDATLMDSVRAAWARRGDILRWSVAVMVVGMVLQALENLSRRLPFAGQIVGQITTRLLGLAWSVTSFMVIPAMIFDECGPREGYRRSVNAIKRTWGEGLTAHISMGFASLLAFMPFIALMVAGTASLAAMGNGTGGSAGPAMGVSLLGFGVLYMIVVQLIFGVARVLFTGALYRFATTGEAGDAYDAELVQGAFAPPTK